MILPSDSSYVKASGWQSAVKLPTRLLSSGVREVSRMEFHSSEPGAIAAGDAADCDEALSGEEIAVPERDTHFQAEEAAAEIEAAKIEARQAARLEWQRELEERLAEERSAVLKVCEEFREERTRYFAEVEAEVVKLSLAIAAQVLHRESTIDPLLLTAVVRIALERLANVGDVVMKVSPGTPDQWRSRFSADQGIRLQILEDAGLREGDCVLETKVGSVELGVSAQLQEIERGFFDLLQRRPRS
jgi:flagellar assembly protein FliH